MNRIVTVLSCIVMLFLAEAGALAQTPIAVLGVEAVDTDAKKAACLTKTLRSQVKQTSGAVLVPGKDLDEIKLVFGCMEELPGCMSRAGKSLNAHKLLWGSVKKASGGFSLTIKMLDVTATKIERTVSKSITRQEMKANCGAGVVNQITSSMLQADRGAIKINATVTGAQVMLGLTVIGLTHDNPIVIKDLPLGSYQIKIEKEGYKPWSRKVAIEGGRTVDVMATLILLGSDTPGDGVTLDVAQDIPEPDGGGGINLWKVAFWSGAAATVGMAVGMGVSGAEVLQAQNEIENYRKAAPSNVDVCENTVLQDLKDICEKGASNATQTNVFLGLTLAAAVASGFFYYKAYIAEEEPTPGSEEGTETARQEKKSKVQWVVAPAASPDGASLGFHLIF